MAALLAAICSASAQTETQDCTKQERNNQKYPEALRRGASIATGRARLL